MTIHRPALPLAGSSQHLRGLTLVAALIAALLTTNVFAQAPSSAGSSVPAPSVSKLETLVGRIALYPDDLVAIILPASTNPLQLVQADRFLDKRKSDPKLPIDDRWDDPVKTLLNYPEIVKAMSGDLDWTTALGEAVVTDQGAVLEAIQTFRRKTQAAGNLKSDAKQVVLVEKEVITIVPADPQVIYVPQYNPGTVIVGGYPSYGYYPAPYPVYSYPYPPGAALATGLIWGAAIGAAWSGNHYGAHYGYGGGNNTINVNNSTNINTGGNVNTGGNANRPGTPSRQPAGGGSGPSQWKPNKQPGQVGRTPSTGVGDSRPGGSGSMGSRPSTQPSGGGGGGAFSGNSSGRQTQMDSSRGASSRNAMSDASGRQSPSANTRQAPSGARSGGGGGGAGGGGGGGGGGGR